MAKNKPKNKPKNNHEKPREEKAVEPMSVNVEIDYGKLAMAIVQARHIESQKEQEIIEREKEEWKKSLGYYAHEEKEGIKRIFFRFFNSIKIFFNLMFFSKKKKVKKSVTSAFMQGITAIFFHAVKFLLWILSIAFIGVMFFHGNKSFGTLDYIYYAVFAFISFTLAGIFRLMAIETEQISERERILGIFTAVMAVIPMIELIISFFKEVG